MAADIDKILEKYNKDVKRHIDVLGENFQGQVKTIGEQYESIQEKLEEHDQRFESIQEKLEEHDQRFDKVEDDLEIIKLDIEFIKNELKQKVSCDEFAALERRVSMLEAKQS